MFQCFETPDMGAGICTFLSFQFVSIFTPWNFHLFMFQFVSKHFETIEMDLENGAWNFHLFMFQFVSKRFETIESVDLEIFCLFQFVSVVLLYNLYVSMFRNTRYGAWNFHLFMFQFVSKRFETIESVDLEIFCPFQFVSVSLLYNLYVSMFRNTRYGAWNFHLFMFQFVSKRFETIESVDLEIFACFNLFQ